MEEPVNLTNLRSMTDGDKDMEKALFKEFIISFEAGINILQANQSANASSAWRKEAHALKGISLTLGAEKLGVLCKRGQDEPETSAETKRVLLQSIKEEYERVKQFLRETT